MIGFENYTQRTPMSIFLLDPVSLYRLSCSSLGGSLMTKPCSTPDQTVFKKKPETVWAVRDLGVDEIRLLTPRGAAAFRHYIPHFHWFIERISEHMLEYPGPLVLLRMTPNEDAEAAKLEKQNPTAPVRFSWRKFPGVLD
jgi:hypothetical protein